MSLRCIAYTGAGRICGAPVPIIALHGMDVHSMAPLIEDPHRAMDRYTEWLDDQLNFASVDQNVDQNIIKGQAD